VREKDNDGDVEENEDEKKSPNVLEDGTMRAITMTALRVL
jgi:hypothetical protein